MSIESMQTPTVTLAFAKLSKHDEEEEKTSLAMVFDKDSPLTGLLKGYIEGAKEELYGTAKGIRMPNLADGDDKADEDEKYENLRGKYVVTTSTYFKVPLFDKYGERIYNSEEFYNGCKVRVEIKAGGYTYEKKKGVKLYLQGLQFAGDGERVGGGPSFKAIEEVDEEDI